VSDIKPLMIEPTAFIVDTCHMDAEETGVYLRLLWKAHNHPQRLIPKEPKQLARVAGCDPRIWRRVSKVVLEFWELTPKGYRHRAYYSRRFLVGPRRPISPGTRKKVFQRDGHACVYCGATTELCVDHVYPHAHGGAHEMSNFQTLCRRCNTDKRDSIPEVH
jgi:hypothetical protein